MSSKKSAPPLHLEPLVSLQLSLILLFLHGLALSAVMTLSLPVWGYLALSGVVLVHFYITFNNHVLGKSRFSILSLVWDGEGDWTLVSGDGVSQEARLLPGSFVHPYLVILNFRLANKGRRTVLLLQDSLNKTTFRKLLMRMKMEGNK